MDSVFLLFGSEQFLCGAYETERLAIGALVERVSQQTDAREGTEEWYATFDEYAIQETPFTAEER